MELNFIVKIGLPLSLILIMLSIGLKLEPGDFYRVMQRPKAFLVGISGQLILVPLLAILVVVTGGFTGAIAMGLLILSFCPGGTSSNLFSDLARGNVALSVSLTLAASLITPFSIPLLTYTSLQYFGDALTIDFPVGTTMIRLIVVMIVPLLLAMYFRYRFLALANKLVAWMSPLAGILFAVVISLIIVQQWNDMFGHLQVAGGAVTALLILAICGGYLLGRLVGLERRDRSTLTIEVGMQNGGTALLVTEGVLHNNQMSVVPVLYGLLMLVPVITLIWFARRENPTTV